MRFATFNVQNLRLRQGADGAHLDGARDEVLPLNKLSADDRALDARDRALTARLIADVNADVLALQEVFDQRSLDHFHDACLAPLGAIYPHRICIPGNDARRHLAFMSKAPLEHVTSHTTLTYDEIGLPPPDGKDGAARVFSRDCLTATYAGIKLLNVHFKAPADAASLSIIQAEASAVRKIIEHARDARWIILGDLNVGDVPRDDVLEVLSKDFGVDLAAPIPASERRTYFNAHYASYARPDRVLVSPAIAAANPQLTVFRQGVSRAAHLYSDDRYADVGEVRPRASDHALLAVDLDQA